MAESSARKNQEQDPHQQQDAPGRAQFFQNGPEKFEHRVEDRVGLSLLSAPRPVVALVEPETGARIGVKLGPELVEFKPVGHTLPELVELAFHAWGCWFCGSEAEDGMGRARIIVEGRRCGAGVLARVF